MSVKKIIFSENAPAPIGPYSQAVLAANTLYVSGQIALDQETGKLILDDIQTETRKVMENLGSVLRAAMMDYQNIVKCSIFVKNMGDFEKINEVYGSFFQYDPPARETVEVSKLPKNVNVEISCVSIG